MMPTPRGQKQPGFNTDNAAPTPAERRRRFNQSLKFDDIRASMGSQELTLPAHVV
jgi:hypothetical protein